MYKIRGKVGYFEHTERAEELSQARISAGRRRAKLKSEFIRNNVELLLKEKKWSPKTIAGRLSRQGHSISGEAIYQWIYSDRKDLTSCLWMYGKKGWKEEKTHPTSSS